MQESESIRQRTSNLLSLIVVGALCIALLMFLATAVSTGDLLWFWPTFGEQPSRIAVHCAGQVIVYSPGSAEYEALTARINADVSGPKFAPPGIGLSEATQSEYWSRNLTLEALYLQPVRMHASFRYGLFDALIYPISGAHSDAPLVFGRRGEVVLPGVNIGDEGAAAAALKNMGYSWDQFGLCSKQ